MLNTVSLLATAALLCLQFLHFECANIRTPKLIRESKGLPTPKRYHTLQNKVQVSSLPPFVRQHGSTSILTCKASGSPLPKVQWLRNGMPSDEVQIEDDANAITSSPPTSTGQLMSTLVVNADDGDEFTCVAKAGLHHDSATTTVSVVENDPESFLYTSPTKPVITSYYTDVMQEMESELVLPCRVYSTTPVELMWFHNDNVVYDTPAMRMLPNGDLLIPELSWQHVGDYRCTVSNLYGSESVTTFVYPFKKE